jgi:hypothetical protein
MTTTSEAAHVRWLLSEKERLEGLIAEAKRARKLLTEINKMIALYGEVEPETAAITASVANIDGKFHCPECNTTFANKSAVGAHLRNKHSIFGGLSGRTRAARLTSRGKGKAA